MTIFMTMKRLEERELAFFPWYYFVKRRFLLEGLGGRGRWEVLAYQWSLRLCAEVHIPCKTTYEELHVKFNSIERSRILKGTIAEDLEG